LTSVEGKTRKTRKTRKTFNIIVSTKSVFQISIWGRTAANQEPPLPIGCAPDWYRAVNASEKNISPIFRVKYGDRDSSKT